MRVKLVRIPRAPKARLKELQFPGAPAFAGSFKEVKESPGWRRSQDKD